MNKVLKRYLSGFLALLVLVCAGYAQGGSGKTFLWKVQNGNSPLYLLGSIHMMKSEHYPLNPVIEKAFEQSDVLGVEINISGPEAMSGAMKMMQNGSMEEGKTLKDAISTVTFNLLEKKLEELGVDYSSFANMKPWLAAMMIMQWEMGKLGFTPQDGIDMHFLTKANRQNKEIVELESIDLQMKLFEDLTKEDGEMFLRSTLLDAEKMEEQMNAIVTAWMNGDVATLEDYFIGNIKKYPELEKMYKKMNDDRNIGMVDKIVSYLNSGKKHFIVVGAAHLVGKKGLVQLLKDKGYTLTQL